MAVSRRQRSGVLGLSKLRRKLRRIHQTMPNEIKPVMEKHANAMLADMQANAPRDTNRAANALQARVRPDGLSARVGLLTPARQRKFWYLRFAEKGTKGGPVKVRRQSVLSNGTEVFGTEVMIPPQPATPFITPAFDRQREAMLRDVQAAIRSTIDKAAAGGVGE